MTRDEAVKWLERIEERYIHGGDEAFDEARKEALDMAIEALERERGEWIERNVTQDRRDAKISEWQSAKCSVCGKYHTTPYMYYFTKYDYCPNCGADMRGEEDDC